MFFRDQCEAEKNISGETFQSLVIHEILNQQNICKNFNEFASFIELFKDLLNSLLKGEWTFI